MHGALGELETACRRTPGTWLIDDRFSQADITVACLGTLLDDTLHIFQGGSEPPYPALRALVERCEALPEFQSTRAKWFAAEMAAS
jgi:glutathione S-transferase